MINFIDTTLRDGEQAPGISFSLKEKRIMAETLSDCGFREIEAGIPVMGPEVVSFIRSLRTLPLKVISWCRAMEKDIIEAEKTGTGFVHISSTLSPRHLAALDLTEEEIRARVPELVRKAKTRFGFVSAGLMDVSRTPDPLITAFLEDVFSAGADRVRLSDTVGTATPVLIQEWSRLWKPWLGKLEFHGHNDLGMATANAHTAVFCGFGSVSGTVTGIGERAGNTSWEELLPSLSVTRTVRLDIGLKELFLLSEYVRNLTGEKIAPRQPFLGEKVFSHESGLHVNSFLKDPLTFQCCLPEEWGLPKGKIFYGTHTGQQALDMAFRSAGITLTDREKATILDRIKKISEREKRSLSKEEVFTFYNGREI